MGCPLWGRTELDTTERLHFHFSLSCIGEGNGNPLQCSGLENPRDGGGWWAAVYGVAQSQTRLKRLCSSSSSRLKLEIKKIIITADFFYPEALQNYDVSTILIFINAIYYQENDTYESAICKRPLKHNTENLMDSIMFQ